jgi:hypothetical protein
LETVSEGAGSGVSVKQPPAMPVCAGMNDSVFQNNVVPQRAQNQRRCGLVPVMA